MSTFLTIHYTMYTNNGRTKQGGSLILAISAMKFRFRVDCKASNL